MLDIKTIKVGEQRANCYIVHDKAGNCFVVDPGDESEKILAELDKLKNINLEYILLTHGHFDHVRAVDAIKEMYPAADVVIGESDIELIRSMPEQGLFVHKLLKTVRSSVVTFSDGERLPFGIEDIKIIATPGHTQGGLCYLIKNNLFSGDTLFWHTVGRTDLPLASEEELKRSLSKIARLPEEVTVYPGHGIETTIKEEKSSGALHETRI